MTARARLAALLAVLLLAAPAPAFADDATNPDPPKAMRRGEIVTQPANGTQWAVQVDGAFVTDAYAQAKLNAFKRAVEERDGFKEQLGGRPAYGVVVLAVAGGVAVGAVVAVVATLAATGNLK